MFAVVRLNGREGEGCHANHLFTESSRSVHSQRVVPRDDVIPIKFVVDVVMPGAAPFFVLPFSFLTDFGIDRLGAEFAGAARIPGTVQVMDSIEACAIWALFHRGTSQSRMRTSFLSNR